MTGLISGGRSSTDQGCCGGERERDPSFSPGVERENLRGKHRSLLTQSKERRGNRNWKESETTVLINCIKGGRFCKGKITDWKAISAEIKSDSRSTRTKKECQRRFDTLTKAHKQEQRRRGDNDESSKKEPSGKLATYLTPEWYEDLEQINQQKQKQTRHLSPSDSGGSPSLGGTQTPCRSDLAEDAGGSGTDPISSLQSSPSPNRTQFQDGTVLYQPRSTESTDLLFQQRAQGSATPNRTGVLHVAEAVDPELHDGEDPGAVCPNHAPCPPSTPESLDKFLQSKCLPTCPWASAWALDNVENLRQFFGQLFGIDDSWKNLKV